MKRILSYSLFFTLVLFWETSLNAANRPVNRNRGLTISGLNTNMGIHQNINTDVTGNVTAGEIDNQIEKKPIHDNPPIIIHEDIIDNEAEYYSLLSIRDNLKKEIETLNKDCELCEKQRKGWLAATVIGGTGTLGTSIGAIIQGKQIKENKEAIKSMKEDLNK